jgi:hypothetical protein
MDTTYGISITRNDEKSVLQALERAPPVCCSSLPFNSRGFQLTRKLPGLCLAYKFDRQLVPGSWDLTLYEKNPKIGGTWFENT